MKKLVCALLPVLIFSAANAQTLFTYGKKQVSKDEFIKAFNKNPGETSDRKKALKEYLDLYINFKLKVHAAEDAKLQDDQNQQFELQNFKRQIAENIINEEANIESLMKEAFDRYEKDIHVAQIFIEVPAKGDTLEAHKKITAAYKALKDGKDFSQAAQEFSNDAYTIKTKGDLGFVTAFTLPYEFENVVYNLKAGNFSAPYKSKVGYHIFRNAGERHGLGTRKVAQILIAVPPGSDAEVRAKAAKTADSVYQLLITKSVAFETMVREVSNDMNSIASNGELPEFSIGQYDLVFEAAAFGLKQKGEISKPFESAYGYHIIKLLEARPVSGDIKDAGTTAWLKEKIQRDSRLTIAKNALTNKHLNAAKYKPAQYNQKELWRFTDSAIAGRKADGITAISNQTALFSFAKQKVTVSDWVKYIKAMRSMPDEQSQKSYQALLKDYVNLAGEEYYKNHLEDFSPSFKQQTQEFKEANMLFGIMDQKVWSKANVDTVGLLTHYQKNKLKYQWLPSADALIITAQSQQIVDDLQKKLKESPLKWRAIADSYGNAVAIDSGRFELGQLPVVDRTNFKAGLITAPVKNESDSSFTLNYIFKVYSANQPRSFEDARGLVISDYQQVLENKWLLELKQKYPVKVNNAVFATIK
jgi:peptidyl-prolyl cis-trans isomerase SurA